MKPESYRELKVLEELSSDSSPTQRHLAEKLGVALGLANLMIRRCVKKGYVKVVSTPKNKIRYLITPKGIAEKTRLTYEYMEYSLYLYRTVRSVLQQTLTQIAQSGGKNVVFFGTGDVAEMAYLTLKEVGLNLIGVVDDPTTRKTFLGLPILELNGLSHLSFDCIIMSSLNNGIKGLQQLQELGVPAEKIILIEHQGPTVRAFIPKMNQLEGSPA